MERKYKIVEKDVTALDVAVEMVSNVAGIGLGIATGYYGNMMLPVARNVGEKILRHVAVDLGSAVVGAIGAKTVQESATEALEAQELRRLINKGLLDSDKDEEEESTTN